MQCFAAEHVRWALACRVPHFVHLRHTCMLYVIALFPAPLGMCIVSRKGGMQLFPFALPEGERDTEDPGIMITVGLLVYN